MASLPSGCVDKGAQLLHQFRENLQRKLLRAVAPCLGGLGRKNVHSAGRPAAVATSAMAASVLIMLAAESLLAQTSSAQIWPTKRVQVIVPFHGTRTGDMAELKQAAGVTSSN